MKRNLNASFQKIVSKMTRKKNKTEQKDNATKEQNLDTKDQVENIDVDVDTEAIEKPISKEEQLTLDLAEAVEKQNYLRAEFQNFRNRTAKQNLQFSETCTKKTVEQILPVVDDFDRAAQQEELSEGISLVYTKLISTLDNLGVKAMETTGESFNPDQHEAITEIPAPTEDLKGKIVDTIEKGYFLHDNILRFAKVVVGK